MEVPSEYRCGCGRSGVKLWREYALMGPDELRCVDCAIAHHDKPYRPRFTDQIGWSVPAVPTELPPGDVSPLDFWGYTSVPDEGVAWWNNLPLRPWEA